MKARSARLSRARGARSKTLMLVALLTMSVAWPCYAQQPPNCAVGGFVISPDETIWVCKGAGSAPVQLQTGGGSSVPSGAILLIDSGTCPSGYSEVAGLDGKTIVGTIAANGNVGSTGGSDSITPQGSISAINQVINHTHTVTVTDPGHTHTLPVGATDDTSAPFDRADAGTNASGANATTASGSVTTGISAVTANPAGGVTSVTPMFTGTAFDNRSAFARVIFCRKA